MHVGGVVILKPDAGRTEFQYSEIVDLIESRLDLVPRYRQKVRFVPGRLARPVWVDDEDFDITYHVRRSALPKPGTDVELDELVGRLISRPLDRTRPLWEVYVIEGLTGGRIALVNKTHHAMVDRIGAVDVAAAILDVNRRSRELPDQPWIPNPSPSDIDLVVDAVADITSRPSRSSNRPVRREGRRRGDVQGAGRRGQHIRGDPSHGEPGAAVGAQRRQERAAPIRHGERRPGGLQADRRRTAAR